VPEASDPHDILYGMTVQKSIGTSHPLRPAPDGDDAGARDLDHLSADFSQPLRWPSASANTAGYSRE
jgi:hypothetical protein